jgi:methylisocitrate lyase
MRVAAHAMTELYGHLRDNGGCEALIDKMTSRADLYDTIGYYDYETLDEGIARTVVPGAPGE